MNSKSLFSILVLLVFLSACNHSTSKYRVKTQYNIYKVSYNGTEHVISERTDTFYYASDGRKIDKTTENTCKEERKGNIIEQTNFDKSGHIIGSSVSVLNAQGLTDSLSIKDATHVTYAHKYLYDANGNMVEDRQYSQQLPQVMIHKYKVVEGNRVEESHINIPSVDTSMMANPTTGEMEQVVTKFDHDIYHSEFYSDKPNMPSDENFGYTSRDVHSKNLEKRQVQLSDKGDTLDVFFFHYLFDDKGRVTSSAKVSRTSQEYDSTAYTYY